MENKKQQTNKIPTAIWVLIAFIALVIGVGICHYHNKVEEERGLKTLEEIGNMATDALKEQSQEDWRIYEKAIDSVRKENGDY